MVDEVLCSGADGVATQGNTAFSSATGVFSTMSVGKYSSLILYNNDDAIHNTIFQVDSVTSDTALVTERKVGKSGTGLKYRVTNDLYRHVEAATKRVDALLSDSAFVPFDKQVFYIATPVATMELDFQLPYNPIGYQLKITVAGLSQGATMNLTVKGYRESVSDDDIDTDPEKVEDTEIVTFTSNTSQMTSKKFISVSEITSDYVTNGSITINLVPPEIISDLTAAIACERIMRVKFSQSVPNASAIADTLSQQVKDMIKEFVTGQAGLGHFETLSSEKSAIRTGELFR